MLCRLVGCLEAVCGTLPRADRRPWHASFVASSFLVSGRWRLTPSVEVRVECPLLFYGDQCSERQNLHSRYYHYDGRSSSRGSRGGRQEGQSWPRPPYLADSMV